MANYGGGGSNWALPQDAAMQAQQAYQQQAVGVPYPQSSAAAVATASNVIPPAVVSPPLSAGARAARPRKNRLSKMEDRVLVTRTADEETEDGRIRNKEAMAKIRDAWVYKQIRARVNEFTEYKQVRGCSVFQWITYFFNDLSPYLVALGSILLWNLERQCQRQR